MYYLILPITNIPAPPSQNHKSKGQMCTGKIRPPKQRNIVISLLYEGANLFIFCFWEETSCFMLLDCWGVQLQCFLLVLYLRF